MNAARLCRVGTILSLALVIGLSWAPARGDLLPAFPGAEGAGAYATGGRGGDVYHVTNLNDSGLGSLRYGIDNAVGARTIVFDVGGMIELNSTLRIRKPHITIAGQTAPGLGICIKNWDTQIEVTHDVVVQHLRFRPGLDRAGRDSNQFHGDSLEMNDVSNIMIDHCSMSWSIDECLGSSGENTNITVQWCYMTEGLHDTHFHPYSTTQKHSDGTLFATYIDAFTTAHHNLWAHDNLRMPRVRSYDLKIHTADIRNNVMYDWGDTAAYGGGDTALQTGVPKYDDHSCWNYCGNYSVAGPSTRSDSLYALEDWGQGIGGSTTWDMAVYLGLSAIEANRLDTDRDGVLDGVNSGWAMTIGPMVQKTAPFVMPGIAVTMDDTDAAYQRVLALAGAMPAFRDSVDIRVTNEVITQTGSIINSQADVGGYPVLPVTYRPGEWDTDQDGMPNWWEIANGFNPDVDDHSGDINGDGYANLEDYLHYMNGAVIPEPSCLSLVLLGALALLVRRHPVETKRRREPG